MSSPFDYANQILYGKKNLITDEQSEKDYIPFLTNRSLSYYFDCVLYSNEMNQRHFLDKKMQNDFLLNTIRSKKRPFVKWAKPEKNDDIEVIKQYFKYNTEKAIEALKLLTQDQIDELKNKTSKGGL